MFFPLAGIVAAKVLHPKLAHVTERDRRADGLRGLGGRAIVGIQQ
jgi:hypothetical protein